MCLHRIDSSDPRGWRSSLRLLGVLLVGNAWIVLTSVGAEDAIRLGSPLPQSSAPGAATSAGGTLYSVVDCNPGPWGAMEFYRIPLSFPEDILPLLVLPSRHTEWASDAASDADWIQSLVSAGFTEEEIRFLRQDAKALLDDEFLRIYPSREVLIGMPEPLRARLYRHLGGLSRNRYHRQPFYFETGNLSMWFERTGVSRDTIFEIAEMAYNTPRGRGFFFSDFPYLLDRIEDPREERLLLRALHRTPTLVLRLRLDEGSDLRAIAGYWTAGFKFKDVLPMLESVVDTPGVTRFEVAHLLPAMARRNLNRYPNDFDGAMGRYPDWFWTCYNFFRFTPRDVYGDSPNRDQIIAEEFEPLEGDLGFGDLVLLTRDGVPVHGCVHIADGIVYVKNSPDRFTPWVLSRIEDVLARQDVFGDLEIATLRWRRRDGGE
jgi:hypothetical protein